MLSITACLFTVLVTIERTEKYYKIQAIKNNAAHWKVTVDPVSGNSTKVFKWGKPVNENNEQRGNEPNELNELNK